MNEPRLPMPNAPANDDDAASRERALDPRRSFLVQAPAGSGKTELLIQRFLTLLATVDRPERILAMTFTRKAAGEMRQRIIEALRDALADKPVGSPHEERTRALAHGVLRQDLRLGWQLVTHPARLAVMTIDALTAGLARQAPLATAMGAAPRYVEHALPLYLHAARAALADAAPDDLAWRRLLAHLDNDTDRIVGLVATMLGKRELWIGELRSADRSRFRAMLEATLTSEIAGELATVMTLIPRNRVDALIAQERYASDHLRTAPHRADLAAHIAACAAAGGLPAPVPSQQERWRALANWLLVAKDARFRELVNVHQGFPAKGNGAGAAHRRQRQEMKILLGELSAVPGLADALDAVRRLPPPNYDDDTWTLVDALLEVLPRAAAHLTLTFRDAGAVDFTQATLAALAGLGDEEAPSDLLLKLDLRLSHILIDEFQDTSFMQLALLLRLIAGWQPDDGRTLFAVGDPMQSIYRFRGAEVRLFIDAVRGGRIGDLPVEHIVLRNNFRSQAGLVEWTNEVFPRVLGSISDPWRGFVGFVPATAALAALPGLGATFAIFASPGEEAEAVIRHIRTSLSEGAKEVAVLVRARTHLAALLPALRTAGIAFGAVDLDALAERQAVLDLASLTHALIQPADRLAWLAVLRAPWCGLTLPDLVGVVAAANARADGSVAALVNSNAGVDGLTAEGGARFARLSKVLATTLAARGRAGVAARIRGAWLALGGPASLEEAIDLDAAEQFFALLAHHEIAGDVPDWARFLDALTMLRAAPDVREGTCVQLMTLHRAKGLEFDTVILPALGRPPNRSGIEILRWRRRLGGLLLAPMTPRSSADDSIHAYLGFLDRGEENAELGRLLYVGCTRAKRRLHLTGVLESSASDAHAYEWKRPPSGSALGKFWDLLGNRAAPPGPSTRPAVESIKPRLLIRLPVDWEPPLPDMSVPLIASSQQQQDKLPFDWARATAKHVGTVAHRLFALIGREGAAAWSSLRVAALAPRIRAELTGQGVDNAELADAVGEVITAVSHLLTDERGRWLLAATHAESQSEWALAGLEGSAVTHVVLDRSFVADGVRWIVDFKTGTHEGADAEAFLDREQERYRTQLERYAHFVRALDARPIRLGIYYPMQHGWREWPYSG